MNLHIASVSPRLLQTDACFSQDAAFPRRVQALALEIGCGNGHFLLEYARLHPEQDCIGVDMKAKRIMKACRKADRLDMPNLRYILGDASALLGGFFSATLFAALLVNFPDPWPKYRHRDNRLNHPAKLDLMLSHIAPGGSLIWVSDYYPQIIDLLVMMLPRQERGEWANAFGQGYAEAIEGYPATLYESKWRAIGRRIYYLHFIRQTSR
ncbi:MAG: methyltransferase domain-containing protein [Spirochaetota bacterium]|jgi:tRNA (guanine-N7-)-methyltransferase|nr:methyltransferase domain-containing protein [Spirochaetota bacterium]